MKKLFAGIGTFIIGAVIVTVIDNLLGINLNEVGLVARSVHTLIYMAWGVIVVMISKRF